MAKTVSRKRIIGNPGRKKNARRSNPGEILGFSLAGAGNPGRKAGSSMAKTKSKKKSSSHRGYKKAKSNPGRRRPAAARRSHGGARHHRKAYRAARSNPGMGSLGPMVTNAVFVIVGALGSKLGAQAVLGTKNVGLLGYAGNALSGGVLWFLTEKVMRNRAASTGVIAGTLVQIVLRIINDYTPFGQYVAQLGMGDYQMQSFVTPQVLVDPYRNAEISIPPGWAPKQIMAAPVANGAPAQTMAAAAGVGNLYGGGGDSLYS